MGGRFYLRAGQRAFCAGQGSEGQRGGEEKERVGREGRKGGDKNVSDTGESFVHHNQLQESRTHTGLNVHVMVKRDCNWGLAPEKQGHGGREMRKRRSMFDLIR